MVPALPCGAYFIRSDGPSTNAKIWNLVLLTTLPLKAQDPNQCRVETFNTSSLSPSFTMSDYDKKETPPKGMGISNRAAGEQDDMSKRNYIRWDAEGVEKVPPNEAEDIQAVADMINACQKAQWNSHRHCFTGSCTSQVTNDPGLIPPRDPRPYTRSGQG